MAGIKREIRSCVTLVFGVVLMVSGAASLRVGATPDDPIKTYDDLYKEGVEKYLKEDWESCVKFFELALEDWHWWQSNVIRCRGKCREESTSGELMSEGLSDEERFFEKSVLTTLCLIKCKKEVFGPRMDKVTEGQVDEDFDMRKPYDYLQLCYYKSKNLKAAADAAATVLARQPDHEVMKNNMKIYLSDGEIKPETVINRELKDYGMYYIQGNTAYNHNNYSETIRLMEKSLVSYYRADDDCRRLCENPFDQGWFPDFISSIANHYTFTLRCKRRCVSQLSSLYGETIDYFFGSFFNYLQYSYYQEGDYAKACEAIASALVVDPEDEMQLRNKEYYLKDGEVTEDMFIPRKDVVAYKDKLDFEEKMMDFIETNFVFFSDDGRLEDVDDEDADQKETEKEPTSAATTTPEGGGVGGIVVNNSSSSLDAGLDSETKVILEGENVVKDEL